MPFICPICIQNLKHNQKSICCSSCLCWVHHNNRTNCSGLTNSEFKAFTFDSSKVWECDKCISKYLNFLPFNNFDDRDLLDNNINNSNQNNLSEDVNHLLPNVDKDFIDNCNSIANRLYLNDDDFSEEVINLPHPVNSKYFSIEQINSLKTDSPSCFSFFLLNIASSDKHIDDLRLILSLISLRFDIIGISEHKILKDTFPSNNVQIPGYNEFIFQPTETACGGTGFYISDSLNYIRRSDLEVNSPSNYESIFVEIKFPKKKNLIVGCMYRHPSSNLSVHEFSNFHLEPVLEKVSKENKKCVLMGNFNINLLK